MKKEAIAHGVWEDLANRNDNWDKLDGVPEKVDLLMESKADKTEVDASLELKADKTYVDTQDLLKADKSTTYTKTEVDASLELKANKQQEAWITPTLLNGWTSYEGFQYRKNQFGRLEFRGRLNPENKTDLIFMQLPIGYRPSARRYVNFGGSNFLAFLTTGYAQNYFTLWVSMDNISIGLD